MYRALLGPSVLGRLEIAEMEQLLATAPVSQAKSPKPIRPVRRSAFSPIEWLSEAEVQLSENEIKWIGPLIELAKKARQIVELKDQETKKPSNAIVPHSVWANLQRLIRESEEYKDFLSLMHEETDISGRILLKHMSRAHSGAALLVQEPNCLSAILDQDRVLRSGNEIICDALLAQMITQMIECVRDTEDGDDQKLLATIYIAVGGIDEPGSV